MPRISSSITLLDFELRFERTNRCYRALITAAPEGAGGYSDFDFDSARMREQLLVLARLSGRSETRTRGADSAEIGQAKAVGGALFDAVFTGDVLSALSRNYTIAHQQGGGLRLKLDLTLTPDLLNYPWEFLYNPLRRRWLAMGAYSPVTRYIESQQDITPVTIDLPLRILAIVSEPMELDTLRAPDEWNALMRALEPLRARGIVVLDRLAKAELDFLNTYLDSSEPYHILHYIGHGKFDYENDEGVLLFQDARGFGDKISGATLSEILRDSGVKLAVLNACEGARTSHRDPFAGVAQSLVSSELPAVVAMQFEISDRAAVLFAHSFYDGLARGFPIDVALARTRKKMLAGGHALEWATPVLYTSSSNGRLFNIQTEIVNEELLREEDVAAREGQGVLVQTEVVSERLIVPQKSLIPQLDALTRAEEAGVHERVAEPPASPVSIGQYFRGLPLALRLVVLVVAGVLTLTLGFAAIIFLVSDVPPSPEVTPHNTATQARTSMPKAMPEKAARSSVVTCNNVARLTQGRREPAIITFSNNSSVPISLFWIYGRSEVPYGLLEPGDRRLQPTFSSDRWIAKGPDGRCRAAFQVTNESSAGVIF
jgi:hypothetical protein